MTGLKELRIKREAVKSQLARFCGYLEGIDAERPDIIQIKARLENVVKVLNEFECIQLEIELKDNNIAAHTSERFNFETEYYNAVAKARAIVDKFAPTTNTPNACSNVNANVQSDSVKLPSLDLPTFDGSLENWLFFRDTFVSVIDNNAQISDVSKFHYLRLALKGEASDVIKSLEVSAANYQTAWTLINERYENQKLLIHNHVKALFDLPVMSKESSAVLRKMLDGVTKHLRALEVLNQPTDQWDTLLIHIITSKLDAVTRRAWEAANPGTRLPTFDNLKMFLKDRCLLLETLQNTEGNNTLKHSNYTNKQKIKAHLATKHEECLLCKKDHILYNCPEFVKLKQPERFEEIKKLRICQNCFRNNHTVLYCKSNSSCRKCGKKHHTLLHREPIANHNENSPNDNIATVAPDQPIVATTSRHHASHVLLSTALVKIWDAQGNSHVARALLDSGSQSSFLTEEMFQKLKLNKSPINLAVTGINQKPLNINALTEIKISSISDEFTKTIKCLIIPRITENLPSKSFDPTKLEIPKNIRLADPLFFQENNIDLLLGADIFWNLTCVGQIQLGEGKPIIQKTRLGWIVAGEVPDHCSQPPSYTRCHFNKTIELQLKKFWEIEEVGSVKHLTGEEQLFEEHFKNTTKRDSNGRFIVKYPLKLPESNLGESETIATKRLVHLERKLQNNPDLKMQYTDFMREYEDLNHMSKLGEVASDKQVFYLPHHCVIKKESLTTKLRVVFDGSAKSDSGISVNDLQMTGANLQDDLIEVVIRFRIHDVVIAADITKMYRQILIDKEQRRLQRIVWRESTEDEVEHFELNTITYGMKSASFLAIRCIQELANQFQEIYPDGSSKIKSDFYVDDLLTGGRSVEEVKEAVRQIAEILEAGKFKLNKWVSNEKDLLTNISSTNPNTIINIGKDNSTKTLGLCWWSNEDVLKFRIKFDEINKVTKRVILSIISRIFDPLGLLGPIVISSKIMLQELWQAKVNWDESIPQHLHTKWVSFYEQLELLNNIEITRQAVCKNATLVELHGFCDASQVAYGAAFYIRSTNEDGSYHTHLLCSKTRVAPMKVLTIPRLELSGALLMAQLYDKIKSSVPTTDVYFWCDSTIVLSWLKSESKTWKVFVANRVSEIQKLTDITRWRHVSSVDNPADMLSRGIEPKALINNNLWFHGPLWLTRPQEEWPTSKWELGLPEECKAEARNRNETQVLLIRNEFGDILERFSNFDKLVRVTAYCLRFKSNTLKNSESKEVYKDTTLNVNELSEATNTLIKMSQRMTFEKELKDMTKSKCVAKNSKLLGLNPFIDKFGIIRVGGRLKNSDLNFEKKHPIVLDAKNRLTKLIVEREHKTLLHAGAQLVLASLRENYWIIGARNLIKGIIRKCMKCIRFKCQNSKYLMGDLPKERITPARPFSNCGVDYAGPFNTRPIKVRKYNTIKTYLCLFVYFATRAVHLELVSDLSTEGFIAALRRFIARRGKPNNIYSDNGKNFVGAIAELRGFLNVNRETIQRHLNQERINWHLIPPRAPHFGGIWEAGVKATKHHLKRVVGDNVLTIEELYTLVVQVESILNSRPLCPLTTDPHDPTPLTPSHFLVGTSLTSLPDDRLDNMKESTMSKYQRVQAMRNHFWQRWRKEYISELQTRTKWKDNKGHGIKLGSLVLERQENVPPQRWPLGRVIEEHPGNDGILRVVTIRTSTGTYKRPVVKLVLIPEED